MKITSFETFQLKAPLEIPFGWSQDTITSRSVGLVKITTDTGISGWGETTLEGKPKSVVASVEELAEYFVGKDPLRIEHHWQHVYRSAFFRGGNGGHPGVGTARVLDVQRVQRRRQRPWRSGPCRRWRRGRCGGRGRPPRR